jgi:peptidoglycan hydrolase-like protein with peptidoglycan-binding domain
MTENKYDTLLKISFAMLAISAVMLCISGYNIYFRRGAPAVQTASASAIRTERDSLQQIYSATIKKLDEAFSASWSSADTLSQNLDVKLEEFNKLRNEITTILKDQSPDADLGSAKEKILELQIRVNALRLKNTDVESENKRLQVLLDQLTAGRQEGIAGASVPGARQATEKSAGPVITTGMHLAAIATTNNKETETNAADEAEKIVGSFSLKNISPKANTELMVIVIQPDGKVVRNSVWESGSFETSQGKKIYSRKISLDGGSNDKPLNFSLNPDRILKGEYTMQIWYNGNMIGKMSKVFS